MVMADMDGRTIAGGSVPGAGGHGASMSGAGTGGTNIIRMGVTTTTAPMLRRPITDEGRVVMLARNFMTRAGAVAVIGATLGATAVPNTAHARHGDGAGTALDTIADIVAGAAM